MGQQVVAVLIILLVNTMVCMGRPQEEQEQEEEDVEEVEQEEEYDVSAEDDGLVGRWGGQRGRDRPGRRKGGRPGGKQKWRGGPKRGHGLKPTFGEQTNKKSEEFFKKIIQLQTRVPLTANKQEFQGPVKDQGTCGSSVAFATTAAVEACYMRQTGVQTILSEQQLLDCAYAYQGANGCNDTPLFSYLEWMATKGRTKLVSAANYPYQGMGSPFTCITNRTVVKAGALIKHFDTNNGDEEQLKKSINEHNAVITAVCFSKESLQAFRDYKNGIFAGCATDTVDAATTCQAVTVVGYGSEGGTDFWLAKNSWGTDWGEKGYFRLRRGAGMCQIAKSMGVVTCSSYDNKKVILADCEEGAECTEEELEEEEEEDEEEDDEYGEEAQGEEGETT